MLSNLKYVGLLVVVVLCIPHIQAQSEAESPVYSFNIAKDVKPPILKVEGQIVFEEPSGNRAIDANEECAIVLTIKNAGYGDGIGLKGTIRAEGSKDGLTFSNIDIPTIKVGETRTLRFPISSSLRTANGSVTFFVAISEPNGFGTNEFPIQVSTYAFPEPDVRYTDVDILETGSELRCGEFYTLRVLVQNLGKGNAENVAVNIKTPENVSCLSDRKSIGVMRPGDTCSVNFKFGISQNFQGSRLPIEIVMTEKYRRFAHGGTINFDVVKGNSSIVVIEPAASAPVPDVFDIARLKSDVDRDIPKTNASNNNTYVMIIGNKNYMHEQYVNTAHNDAFVMKEYCVRTLGIPESNVDLRTDLSYLGLDNAIREFVQTIKIHNTGKFLFFYFGHGMRTPNKNDAYLLPIDAWSSKVETQGISRDKVLRIFSEAEPSQLVVYLESCFTGGQSASTGGQDVLVAVEGNSGVVIADEYRNKFKGNIVVFSASSEAEPAYAYVKEGHNVFTYAFLKTLKECKGELPLGDIFDAAKRETAFIAWDIIGRKHQNPTFKMSSDLKEKNWRKWKLR